MKKIKKDNGWEYFNDCLICQAMEKSEKEGTSLSEKDLETVFSKQSLKNKLKGLKA